MREDGIDGLLPRYYFGLYHWRERGRRILLGLAAVAIGIGCVRRSGKRSLWVRLAASIGAVGASAWGVGRIYTSLRAISTPPPWRLERAKYEALAAELPLSSADRFLDVGCGTGRSLVGLAPAVAEGCEVIACDVFDSRIILGNAPRLAVRNATRAGLDAAAVRGDASRLPIAGHTADVVTLCRLLHDLPQSEARGALEEARRVCDPDGRVGVLALPYPHESGVDATEYWKEMVEEAGFDVETLIERDDGYTIVVGRPS
ncbi:MAG: class I SAM-dependent methyltransferase [Natronomonas sp.]